MNKVDEHSACGELPSSRGVASVADRQANFWAWILSSIAFGVGTESVAIGFGVLFALYAIGSCIAINFAVHRHQLGLANKTTCASIETLAAKPEQAESGQTADK